MHDKEWKNIPIQCTPFLYPSAEQIAHKKRKKFQEFLKDIGIKIEVDEKVMENFERMLTHGRSTKTTDRVEG